MDSIKLTLLYSGAVVAVGGPYLTLKLTPTEEELFKRYNPELQKRSLENRGKREQEFDDFVTNMKEAAKSDKHSSFYLSYGTFPRAWKLTRITYSLDIAKGA